MTSYIAEVNHGLQIVIAGVALISLTGAALLLYLRR